MLLQQFKDTIRHNNNINRLIRIQYININTISHNAYNHNYISNIKCIHTTQPNDLTDNLNQHKGYIQITNKTQKYNIDNTRYYNTVYTLLQYINATQYDLSITLTTDSVLHRLNKQHRNKDTATDILSFPPQQLIAHTNTQQQQHNNNDMSNNNITLQLPPPIYDTYDLGDIYISLDYAQRQCDQLKCALFDRLCRLTVHGIVHLCGYDHENDNDYNIMIKHEIALMNHIKALLDKPDYTLTNKRTKSTFRIYHNSTSCL